MANHFFQIYEQLPSYIVVTFPLSLRWMRGPPRTECEQKQHHVYMWREQAITEWSPRVNSIVACCHGAKPCAHAARAFRSQQKSTIKADFQIGAYGSNSTTIGNHCRTLRCWSVSLSKHVTCFVFSSVFRIFHRFSCSKTNPAIDAAVEPR